MRLDKCDAYKAKETIGYRGRKMHVEAKIEKQVKK